jgi:hypothetical protein
MSSEISSLKVMGFFNSVHLNTCKLSFYTVLECPKNKFYFGFRYDYSLLLKIILQLDENETKTTIYSKIVSFTNLGILDK